MADVPGTPGFERQHPRDGRGRWTDETGPHGFRPLRPWDALHKNGRCRHCFAPKQAHPIHFWIRARPLGDFRRAELSFEVLSGEKP